MVEDTLNERRTAIMVTNEKARKAYNRLGSYCQEHEDCADCIFNVNYCLMDNITGYTHITKENMYATLTRLESEKENS